MTIPVSLMDGKMKGIYILAIEVLDNITVEIGTLGLLNVRKGIYLYIGSALGQGSTSLESRIKRHNQKRKKRFWHIDYLTTHLKVKITFTEIIKSEKKIECKLTDYLTKTLHGTIPFKNFGSSDCLCGGHLIHIHSQNRHNIQNRIHGAIQIMYSYSNKRCEK